MSTYERLTKRIGSYVVAENQTEVLNRLAGLEDKIDAGTLVEFPRIITYVDYCYGLEKYVVQWIDNGKIKSKTFWDEKKAFKKFKECQ